MSLKGIVLAGGLGTRLSPLTQHDNKHFLPVYNKRMIEYPINSLVQAGVKDIVLVTGGKYPGRFLELFKNGHSHGIEHLYYAYQDGEGGIADALKLAHNFCRKEDSIMVILGDNYFEGNLSSYVKAWTDRPIGAQILLKGVEDPERFGIAFLDEYGNILRLEEKPSQPSSNLAVTGCYFFDFRIWNILETLTPSRRNELEIVDALQHYLKLGELRSCHFQPGHWSDMGTFESLSKISQRIASSYESNTNSTES